MLPSHQRQGLGKLLLEDSLRYADEQGARTYIEASRKGVNLYLKHGWVQVDEILIDMRPHGGDLIEPTICLMREPRTGVDLDV